MADLVGVPCMGDSSLKSASGDCLTYSETDEVAIRTAQKRFQKKV